jgi:hypothetical protein
MSEFIGVIGVLGVLLFMPWDGADSLADLLFQALAHRLSSFSAWLAVL